MRLCAPAAAWDGMECMQVTCGALLPVDPHSTAPLPAAKNRRTSAARPVDILVANFEAAYSGNRAPFPIYISSRWLRTGQHLRGLQLFAGAAPCCLRLLLGCIRGPRATHPLNAKSAPLHLLALPFAALQRITLLDTWHPHHSAPQLDALLQNTL